METRTVDLKRRTPVPNKDGCAVQGPERHASDLLHRKIIRDDAGNWKQIEIYIHDHSEAEFSQSICPDCDQRLYPEHFKKDI